MTPAKTQKAALEQARYRLHLGPHGSRYVIHSYDSKRGHWTESGPFDYHAALAGRSNMLVLKALTLMYPEAYYYGLQALVQANLHGSPRERLRACVRAINSGDKTPITLKA